MFSRALLLALLTAPSLLVVVAAAPQPATNDNSNPASGGGDAAPQPAGVAPAGAAPAGAAPAAATAPILYTITSATIKQYDEITNTTTHNRLRRRQNPPAATTGATTGAPLPTDGPGDGSTPAAFGDTSPPAADEPSMSDGHSASAYRPSYNRMENFNLQLNQGGFPQPGAQPIACNLTWNAGEANGVQGVVSKQFTCTDATTAVRMERRNVTPLYGFYIFVQIGSNPQAAWMVRDPRNSAGWNVSSDSDSFQGAAFLRDVPHQTLEDFLAGQ